MKKSILLGMLALASFIYADDDLISYGKKPKTPQKTTSDDCKMQRVSLASARPECDNGAFLFADALYWHVDIGSADWANANTQTSPVPAVPQASATTGHNHSLNFKWNWGFRVGIGANIDHDMWDSRLYYTWLFAEKSNKIGNGTDVVFDQIGIGSSTPLTSGSTKWDFHFSMFDWDLGRWNYMSKNLALRPHAGIKGGWIHWKIHTKFSAPNITAGGQPVSGVFIDEKFQNNFWGVGPALGVNALWVLGNAGKVMDHRFSLFGDIAGALMYGHFNIKNKQVAVNSAGGFVDSINQKGLDRNLAASMLQGTLGLSYDTAFNSGKNHFMLNVGYELQYWFRQNQLVASTTLGGQGVAVSNRRITDDLALQGVTAEFRFDF